MNRDTEQPQATRTSTDAAVSFPEVDALVADGWVLLVCRQRYVRGTGK
jgi:hypothetical protein